MAPMPSRGDADPGSHLEILRQHSSLPSSMDAAYAAAAELMKLDLEALYAAWWSRQWPTDTHGCRMWWLATCRCHGG